VIKCAREIKMHEKEIRKREMQRGHQFSESL